MVSGLLATLMLPGSKDGFLVGLKYLTPGIVVDLILPVLGGRLDRLSVAVVVAAIANTTKLVTSYIVGVVLGIPAGYLALGLGIAATTHIVFGGLGGALAAELLRRLYRTGVIGTFEAVPKTEVE